MAEKFIILGTSRSGTTMLVNSLDKLQGISCFGEILTKNPNGKTTNHWQQEMIEQRKLKNENCYGKWLENYPHSSLSDYLDDLFSRNKFVGFKLLYEHYIKNKKELDDYFSKNDVKFIFIKRKDTIKQAISHKLKKSEQFKNKIYVKYEWVKSKSEEIMEQNKILEKNFLDFNPLMIYYEDITNDTEIKSIPLNESEKILKFIGYSEIKEIPVLIKKHWPDKIEDRIINFSEFV